MELTEIKDEKQDLWQRLILPEEDRDPTMPRVGGYRWFRSPNVVPIERHRRARKQAAEAGSARDPY
jgi:hypothetical protein